METGKLRAPKLVYGVGINDAGLCCYEEGNN